MLVTYHISNIYPRFDAFSTTGGFFQGWRLGDNQNQKFQNHDAFTQRSFNTEKLLHTETFAHRNSEADAHRNFYAKKSLQRSFYTQKLWVAEEGKEGVPSCARCAHGPPPCGLITNVSLLNSGCPPRHSELIRARNANGFQMLATSLSNLGKMLGHHFHPHRNVETVQPSEVEYIPMNTLHEESTGAL